MSASALVLFFAVCGDCGNFGDGGGCAIGSDAGGCGDCNGSDGVVGGYDGCDDGGTMSGCRGSGGGVDDGYVSCLTRIRNKSRTRNSRKISIQSTLVISTSDISIFSICRSKFNVPTFFLLYLYK